MTKKYFKKILVQNPKDLQIISALSAESTTKISDIKYLPKNKIFLLSIDRKDKENNDDLINSIIKFSFIRHYFHFQDTINKLNFTRLLRIKF